MNIIVHIGTEKTGTTTIQHVLHNNHEKLIERGFYFLQSPGTTNNREIPAYCVRLDRQDDDYLRNHLVDTPEKRDAFQKDFILRFDAELAAIPDNVHTVIASSEHFHSRLYYDDEIQTLHRLLESRFDQIRILTYLRKQVDTAVSRYSTAMLSGFSISLEEFFVRTECVPESVYYNYDNYLSRWEGVFGRENMSVRLFDRREFVGGNLIADFFWEIEPHLITHLDTELDSKNTSINHFGQTLMRSINRHIPQFVEGVGFDRQNIALSEMIIHGAKGEGIGLSEDDYTRIQQAFTESNEAVRRRYFPDRKSLFDESMAKAGKETVSDAEARLLDDIIGYLARARIPAQYAEALVEASHKIAWKEPLAARAFLDVANHIAGGEAEGVEEVDDMIVQRLRSETDRPVKRVVRTVRARTKPWFRKRKKV